MKTADDASSNDPVFSRALLLADDFLASARGEIMELAGGDLERLRATAAALRATAADRTTGARGAEHIAYLIVASAFNQLLAARDRS